MTRHTMRGLWTALMALLWFGPLSGCGPLLDQLQANKMAVAFLMHSPARTHPSTGATIPELTTLSVQFGQVDQSKLLAQTDGSQQASVGAFTGLSGATVQLLFTSGGTERQISLADKGNGQYLIDSGTAGLLTFTKTAYTVQIAHSGQTYRLRVTPPDPQSVAEFATNPVVQHTAGQPFTLTRSPALGSANPVAFAHLIPLESGAQPEWTNMPKDGLGWLSLTLNNKAFRTDSIIVPGSALTAGRAYAATLTAVESGGNVTDDGSSALMLGSTFFAGVASGGALVVP